MWGRAPRPPGERREQTAEDVGRLRRTAVDEDVDGHDGVDAAGHGIATAEDAARARAVAHRHDQLGVWRGLPRLAERHRHVPGDGAGDEQQVRVARRGHEVDAEALAVVYGAGQPADLQLAAVAGAGVDLADGQGAAEQPLHARVELAAEGHDRLARFERLGDDTGPEDLGEEEHASADAPRAPAAAT